jgi:hypothetical protein
MMNELINIRAEYAIKNLDWKEFDDALKAEQTMILRRIIRREYKSGNYLSHLKQIEDNQFKKEEKDPYWWITINPHPKFNLKDIKYKIQAFVKRKIVANYIYVYEQRGTCKRSCGSGIHLHVLIKKDKKTMPTVFKRDIKNSFKAITDVNNKSVFNVHACPKKYLKDKYEYMTSVKTGDKKDIKQKYDIVFRKNNNLKKIYFDSLEPFGLKDNLKK